MHALSMIDTGKNPVDVVAPVKSMDKNGEQFGKVLNEKQQLKHQHESKPVDAHPETAEGSKDKQVITQNHKSEMKQETPVQEELLSKAAFKNGIQSEDEVTPQLQAKVQNTLVDLMKAMLKGEPMKVADSSDSIEPMLIGESMKVADSSDNIEPMLIGESMKVADSSDNIEPLLSGESMKTEEKSVSIETLLTDLVQQLEATEPHGEQVLAGIDLSALVTELQSLSEDSDSQELLAQLVTQVEEQLTDESSVLENVDLTAAMAVEAPQQNVAPVVAENLMQMRQILQKAIDSVISQKSVEIEAAVVEENVAVVEPLVEETVVAIEESIEVIDPRFAGLLKPRAEQHPAHQVQSAKEQISLRHGRQQTELVQNESAVQDFPEEMLEQKQGVDMSQVPGSTTRTILENLVQQGQNTLQSQGQASVQGLEMNRPMSQVPVVQLASGQQVAESQIFDQVVTHLSGSVNGESGRMVLRLQPAELGSLKLELMVEGDRIRANLHAQSHQVQEVLERNLPQLRNALAEQGLKIDQFQVNIDQRQQNGQFENLAQQHQHHGSEKQPGWNQQDLEPEEQIIPLAHLMQNGGGGISLHV